MIIRNENKDDYRAVEELTRNAFWNLYCPGCDEHYLVHIMREHPDFIPELGLIVETDGKIIANVMYTRAKLINENGKTKEILTFGPLCVLPEYQRMGYGRKLLEYSFEKAIELGYDTVVIFGNPENYVPRGFKSCKKYNISLEGGSFPTAMLVKELIEGAIPKGNWTYHDSPIYDMEEGKAEEFDKDFEPLDKEYLKSQELFYIYSHSEIIK